MTVRRSYDGARSSDGAQARPREQACRWRLRWLWLGL